MAQRILVVDDDQQIVRLVRSYLEQAGMTVLMAYDGETAKHVIKKERPDLVILDLMLPGHSGWEITRWLRADSHLSDIPVLMLTAKVEDEDKITGLELGADDYLTKPFNPLEVVARSKAILRRARGGMQPPHVLENGDLRLDLDQHTLTHNSRMVELTRTEFAILSALMANPNYAFTREELVEKALGYSYEGLERTLDTHIKNLRKKIDDDPAQPRYIETVFGVGYRFREGAA
ncbi:MAG: response regulator transcription factor [Chloroflexi bacterium]|nr:response regulator transcription factor [Chloroflexota bacterium]MCC6895075.1 response regulator transcription factor [Anaerolineae bacterium]